MFRGAFFGDITMGVDFDSCVFDSCDFLKLRSDAHLWGNDNRWTRCTFREVALRDVASPGNRFESCGFERVSLVNYQVSATVFEGCNFLESVISGLRGRPSAASGFSQRHTREQMPAVEFLRCEFRNVVFRESYFENVRFQDCRFPLAVAIDCNFDGVTSDLEWWGAQGADPFVAFLRRLLEAVESELGPNGTALAVLGRYVEAYVSGATQSRDFSSCLYEGEIPNHELDIVEDVVARLIRTHPF